MYHAGPLRNSEFTSGLTGRTVSVTVGGAYGLSVTGAKIDCRISNESGSQDDAWRTWLDPGSRMTLRGARLNPSECEEEV